ncbi:La-domain-containing protein [Basidiobolus meristosporus CBS 931.73]|uniref:La-domain-containing protein n=1 Tax=Basidiobolus meristosporus CBS 931.73 TaxID=1314790 RepID=A0A1Y1XY62_9FUNG|nr:La-domain-containing protein [Basidiobolus meristosporus CBS 931.73]|eukprot:ORX90690.1 La-domain-containing protein [Basidiobolus meristosporus CBS 931.73]
MTTELKSKILKQVEFYFSDSNLPKDKFLSGLANSNDGWVSIATIASFKRMRQFTDKDLIVEALRESPELLEVNEEGAMVRRTKPLSNLAEDSKRFVYVKGFPEEYPELQEELEKFFEEHGKVLSVRMRRARPGNNFKGSVFVEFATSEEADELVAKSLKFKDADLIVMRRDAYHAMKEKEHGSKKDKSKKANSKRNARELPQRCMLHFKGVGPNTTWQDIKARLGVAGTVAFVKYQKGDNEGYAQFKESLAEDIVEKLKEDAELLLDGVKPELRVLDDEEAKKFYENRNGAKRKAEEEPEAATEAKTAKTEN